MVQPAAGTDASAVAREHGFWEVGIARVVDETPDARSLVLDVPPELTEAFSYAAGQFCTFRVRIDDRALLRCYSMSSAPSVDEEIQVTVKRVPGGVVSNWMCDTLGAGDVVEVTRPAGVFRLTDRDAPILAVAAGSGITPVYSLVKEALATTRRPVHLLYANRDRASTIFAAGLDQLAGHHPDRLRVEHRLDVEAGFVDVAAIDAFAGDVAATADAYVCGPTPFMDIAEASLVGLGVGPERLHIERFTPAAPEDADTDSRTDTDGDTDGTTITIELDGATATTEHHPGTTILQAARQAGLTPPSSCESGSCATCMARLVEGTVTMYTNDALTDAEVAEGWVLTCQSVPTSTAVHVVYGFD